MGQPVLANDDPRAGDFRVVFTTPPPQAQAQDPSTSTGTGTGASRVVAVQPGDAFFVALQPARFGEFVEHKLSLLVKWRACEAKYADDVVDAHAHALDSGFRPGGSVAATIESREEAHAHAHAHAHADEDGEQKPRAQKFPRVLE